MVHRNPTAIAVEERRREQMWLAAMHEATETSRDRFTQVAALLRLGPRTTRAFVNASLEVARQYHSACTYANYERRCGHPYPYEPHAHEADMAQAAWLREMERLASSVATDAEVPAGM